HPGPTFFSLAVFSRPVGLVAEDLSPRLRELVSTRVLDRARVLGAALRVAYLVSASTTGVLPRTPMVVERGRLLLRFDNGFKDLAGERVFVRLRQLARLIGREPVMEAAGCGAPPGTSRRVGHAGLGSSARRLRGGVPCQYGRDC